MFSEPYLVQRILSFATKYNHANLWENIYFLFLWLLKKIMLASIQGDITMSNHLLKEKTNGNFSAVYFQKLSCFDRSLSFFLTLVESNLKKMFCFTSSALREKNKINLQRPRTEWVTAYELPLHSSSSVIMITYCAQKLL